jgi:hypothetical protein
MMRSVSPPLPSSLDRVSSTKFTSIRLTFSTLFLDFEVFLEVPFEPDKLILPSSDLSRLLSVSRPQSSRTTWSL